MVFLDELLRLQTNGALPTDTVITCCGGKEVHAHALTLGAMSPVLLAALRPDRFKEGQSRELDLSWADAEHVEFAIAFAFAKDADLITGENAMALLHLANRLDFEELHNICEAALCSLLTSDNAGEIFECAEQCNCPELAEDARAVRDDPAISQTVSILMERRREVTREIERLKTRQKANERAEKGLQYEMKNLTDRIDFETEKAFKEASLVSSSRDESDSAEATPSYPHAVGRTLVVTPESPKKKKKSAALQFETLGAAIDASRSGDLITLPPGKHSFWDDDLFELKGAGGAWNWWEISKSLQIVGSGPSTALCEEEGEEMIKIFGGADVRLANLCIDGKRILDSIVKVETGSCVWLDACEFQLHRGGIDVSCNSSAVLTGCTFRGGDSMAVRVDPQAKRVIVLDSCISRCGAGSEPYRHGGDPWWLPGDAGAIEVSASGMGARQRKEEQASVKLEVRRTKIISCFGHALSYRTDYEWNGRSTGKLVWPGQAEITLSDNTIKSNGLAIPGAADDANAEAFHLNSQPIGDDRPGFRD